jgi:hypothetical protein
MNGDGVKTLGISEGVKFDLYADGKNINTGWVSGGDGLLVLDRNHDGAINDGSELFGSSTKLANGERAKDGYEALRELDSNHDGVISNEDDAYADLRVWVDGNSDGISGEGETRSLESLGIAKINLNATVGTATDNGNVLGLTSSYETTDGVTHEAADVWFVADKGGVNAQAGTLDAAIAALNSANTATLVAPENEWATGETASLDPGQSSPPVAGASDDLGARVSSLAQAIGSFTEISADGTNTPQLESSNATAMASSPAALAVGGMAGVMQQFDANGNPAGAQVAAAPSATKSLNLAGVNTPSDQGYLASGG